jgi:endonuclease/exonuclease/phosphatase family metal-dependent hydrolase
MYHPDDGTLTVVSYNVENLFDAQLDGTEYHEFTPAAGWDERDVTRRLQGLGGAIGRISPAPEILVLTEVETRDLLDRLLDEFVVDLPLRYRVFARAGGGATGVAVASAFPVVTVRTLLARADSVPPLRPILEVHIRLPETDLVVFANHWKSKRGSAPATEPLRRASARLLSSRINTLLAGNPSLPILVCGDLNEQPREGELVNHSYETALITADALDRWRTSPHAAPDWYVASEARPHRSHLVIESERELITSRTETLGTPVLFNPWDSAETRGSYVSFGGWEQIDHILASAGAIDGPLSFLQFRAVVDERTCTPSGEPLSWTESDTGVSDHLPVLMQLARRPP